MTYAEAAAAFRAEQGRHFDKWGNQHGLRFTHVQQLNTPLDDTVDGGGIVLVSQISGPARAAFLLAPAGAEVVFEILADRSRRIVTAKDPMVLADPECLAGLAGRLVEWALHPTEVRIVGTTEAVVEELQHKLLASAGLVPYRLRLGGAEYRLEWPGGTSVPVSEPE